MFRTTACRAHRVRGSRVHAGSEPFAARDAYGHERQHASRERHEDIGCNGSAARRPRALWRAARRPQRVPAAARAADPGRADDDGRRRARGRRPDLRGRACSASRCSPRSSRTRCGSLPAALRLSGVAVAVPRVAVARHLRAADRGHLRALRFLFARGLEVRARVLDRRAAGGRGVANAVRPVPRRRASRAPRSGWARRWAWDCVFATQIEAVLAWIGRNGVLAALVLLAAARALHRVEGGAALAACALRRRARRSSRTSLLARWRTTSRRSSSTSARGSRRNRVRICPARCSSISTLSRRTTFPATAASSSIARARTRRRRSALRRCCSRAGYAERASAYRRPRRVDRRRPAGRAADRRRANRRPSAAPREPVAIRARAERAASMRTRG